MKEGVVMFDRNEVSRLIREWTEKDDRVRAIWEGGSAATGHLDEWSDLDLSIVVTENAVEEVFSYLDLQFAHTFGIRRKYRVPEPAWHGFSQCFYQIDRVPPLFYLDIALIKTSLPDKFIQPDRHGNAVVWFDKDGWYQPVPSTTEEMVKRCKTAYKNATTADFVTAIEVRKQLARERFSEAFPMYYAYLARHLAPLLNLKHRPAKVDFGLRYAYRDYPEEDAKLVENALRACSIDVLSSMFDRLERRFAELSAELSVWKQ